MDLARMALLCCFLHLYGYNFFMRACFVIQLYLLCVLWNMWDTIPKVLDFLCSQIRYDNMYAKLSFFHSGLFFVSLMFFNIWNVLILGHHEVIFVLFWREFINTHSDYALQIASNLHINSLPYFSFMTTDGNTSWKVSHCCLL